MKYKAHASPETPLTIKWEESIEAGRRERSINALDLATLVAGFVIGLGVLGFCAWFLGQRFWPVDALLGGFVTSLRVHRWAQKRFRWHAAKISEKVSATLRAVDIKRRRRMYSIPGVVIGFAAVGLAAWLQGESRWIFEAIMGSLGGHEVAARFGEGFRGLPALDDLALVRMREQMSPLDLKAGDRVPVTLKTPSERKAKR